MLFKASIAGIPCTAPRIQNPPFHTINSIADRLSSELPLINLITLSYVFPTFAAISALLDPYKTRVTLFCPTIISSLEGNPEITSS